ncbi:MAG: RidA family protein [Alphaproteobacteria bacterium]|nr:RidA family protein [Alphaproteobacteria bacterium]
MSEPVAENTVARAIALDPDPFENFYISQGFVVGNLVFLSGQVAIDEHGKLVGEGDFDAQADQAIRNVQRALRAVGSDLDKIFKVTVYVADMRYRENVFRWRQRWFQKPYPADTLVQATLGRPERLIEVDATALLRGRIER